MHVHALYYMYGFCAIPKNWYDSYADIYFHIIRFEALDLKCLNDPIREKLAEIVTKFNADIDRIQNVNENVG